MAKRFRDFLRVNLTAKTATFIRKSVVDKTFNDHYGKCEPHLSTDVVCTHIGSGNLDVARAVEAGIKIGKKRATLDLACPYSLPEPKAQIWLLEMIAVRISEFATVSSTKKQLFEACDRVATEILTYAHRNAMQVIAEAAL